MFYVNRMIQRFTARQEIPTAAVRPRNDIYGGAVQDSTININLPPLRLHAARQPQFLSATALVKIPDSKTVRFLLY